MNKDSSGVLSGRRLLLVEDEALIAMELEDLINRLGAEVIGPYGRLADALEALGHHRVDGAFLDAQLDGDMTFQIADLLLQAGNPVLFVTGAAAGSIPQRYLGVPRLHKPFDYEELECMAKLIFAGD